MQYVFYRMFARKCSHLLLQPSQFSMYEYVCLAFEALLWSENRFRLHHIFHLFIYTYTHSHHLIHAHTFTQVIGTLHSTHIQRTVVCTYSHPSSLVQRKCTTSIFVSRASSFMQDILLCMYVT